MSVPPMDVERTLLQALHSDPADAAAWLALADFLEEIGRETSAELIRLRQLLLDARLEDRPAREGRLRQLLDAGVTPVGPRIVNSLGMRFTLIPAGSFLQGSPEGEPGRHHDEDPLHRVDLTTPFYLGIYPVTQGEYRAVMESNPSHFGPRGEGARFVEAFDTSSFPVERVSWEDAFRFCELLSRRPAERQAGRIYRLPTEAEWEYACRAGTTTLFHYGNALTSHLANIDGNLPAGDAPRGRYLARTCPVGSFPPNALGLYDMHGNVWEWCQDWFDDTFYPRSPRVDPEGPPSGTRRVLRGGGWFYGAHISRSAYRYRYEPGERHNDFGFRVAMAVRQG